MFRVSRSRKRTYSVLLVILSATRLAFCGGDARSPLVPSETTPPATPEPAPQPAYVVTSFVRSITASDGAQAQAQSTAAPSPSGGPASTVTGNNRVINGGSNLVSVRANTTFQNVYVYIGGTTGGVGGHWLVHLTAPVTSTTLTVTFGQSIPASAFDFVVGVASATGAVGEFGALQTQVIAAGTGAVQVSASWDKSSDVDLHVIDPRGEEVYWNHPSSASGGALDLDSNAGCDIDGKNNENIRWPSSTAPAGVYTVRLDYWSSCGVSQTAYVVTVNNGTSTTTYTGTFTGNGDQGDRGSGRLITTFSRSSSASTADFASSGPSLLIPASISALKSSIVRTRESGR